MLLKRDIKNCTSLVLSLRKVFGLILGYAAMKARVRESWHVKVGYLTTLLTSSTEPGSTAQADISELELAACEMLVM